MRMIRKMALAAGASFGMAFLAACSDSPTSTAAAVSVPKPSFNVGDVTSTPAPEAVTGKIVLCKTGNVGGSFSFTRTTEGPTIVGSSYVGTGPIDIANGTCLEIANDDSPSGSGSHITITEAPAANTVQSITACRFRGYALDGVTLNPPEDCVFSNGGDLFLNHFHGWVVTYDNVFTTDDSGDCTHDKSWYRNNSESGITGVDGLTQTVEAAIFAATPGKPGLVTWNFGNNVLNLYQQLLAALESGGASGPAAVQTAISQAQALTSVAGYAIVYTGDQRTLSNLINTLSSFNEGNFPDWPQCVD